LSDKEGKINVIIRRQSVAFPPTPYEFYQQSDVDSDLILPPPSLIDDESASFVLPPPPLEIDPVVKRRNLNNNHSFNQD
jgi:hypothetical protein